MPTSIADNVQARLTSLLQQTDNLVSWEILAQICQQWESCGEDYLQQLHHALTSNQALLATLAAINQRHDLGELLNIIIDRAIELSNAERGFLLVEEVEIARNFEGEDICGDYKISRTVAATVKSSGRALLCDNAQFDPKLQGSPSIRRHRMLSILCVPIFIQGQCQGVIYVDNRLVRGSFNAIHLNLMTAFAAQIAVILENERMHRELQERSHKLRLLNSQLDQELKTQSRKLQAANRQLVQFQQQHHYHHIYAHSPQMLKIFKVLEKIKDYHLPILIQGESGTGKELVARAIHCSSSRCQQPFLSENCAAIPEHLFEKEFFGHEKGAFSGAHQREKGLFEEAEGGTLFLDEIGDISLDSQKKLLRVLAEKQIRRIGAQKTIAVDVRIISATNCDLQQMVHQGQFREDLFYRLNGVNITLPPLRQRRQDIPLLVERFLDELAQATGQNRKKLPSKVLNALMRYDWPGNIRQLRNEIERLHIFSDSTISYNNLSEEIKGPSCDFNAQPVRNLSQLSRETEKKEIQKALNYTNNNKTRAAQLLGISRFTLLRKMEKLGLASDER